ncbi:RapZ C-terminal domain-containing protein [[Kitasatospora] papulosa]|uniref:RapZ C-terminal domain-containing protein n=1 Tax=[Kitasatospora] papulosa TaxID=1464011 RepID=UPI00368CD293
MTTPGFDPALRKVEVTSFGFLHDFPDTAGNVLLVNLSTKLRNPFDDPEMRHRTGLEPEVSHHVLSTPGAVTILEETLGQVEAMLRGWADPHFRIVRVLVGCRGGKHRSVAMAEAVATALNDRSIPTLVEHLHVDRPVVGA